MEKSGSVYNVDIGSRLRRHRMDRKLKDKTTKLHSVGLSSGEPQPDQSSRLPDDNVPICDMEPDVVYHGPPLDAEGGALEMKLITPEQAEIQELTEQVTRSVQKISVLYKRITQGEARIEALIDLIGDLTDAEPCSLDHHGNCQNHNYQSPCPMPRAQKIFRDFKANPTSEVEE